MGLLDKLFPRHRSYAEKTIQATGFKTITEYAPVFSTWNGQIYEQMLVRTAIEKTAALASKLKPEIRGEQTPRIVRALDTAPNQYMTWPQMISRLVTIYLNDNTAAVVPAFDGNMNITGIYPLKFDTAEVVEYAGEPWIRFYLDSGDTMAIEKRYVCLITRFQYESDFFGGDNAPLNSTLRLMDYQEQAQANAIKNGAKIQFIAQASSTMRPEDIDKKRKEFSDSNLSEKNDTGIMVYDNTFDNVKQVEPMSYVVGDAEMQRIQQNVFNYFGINEAILQSDYTGEQFSAFYESQIEPFAVQLGEGLTQMLWTVTQRRHGCRIMFSSNRLEYASNAEKRNMVRDMTDRGIMTVNEGREILQLPPSEHGDVFIIRGEYVILDKHRNIIAMTGGRSTETKKDPLLETPGSTNEDNDFDLGGDDQEYQDNDSRGTAEVDN